MTLVDTHAHLDFTDDKEGWCQKAKDAGVGEIICVGTSVEASKKCVEIAEKYSSKDSGQARMTKVTGLKIYATVGIHAQDGKDDVKKYNSLLSCYITLKQIVQSSEKVVGIGEAGYDFREGISAEEKKFQKELFKAQIDLASELNLPLVVHCRNAWDETFDLLSTVNREPLTGLFHSWTGDWEAAQKALALGFYISFSGIVTFKNAPAVREVAAKVPLEKMLLETDSPFLSPEPLRGKQNEPKNVKIVAEFIARLRDLPVDSLADVTSKNAGRLFGIE